LASGSTRYGQLHLFNNSSVTVNRTAAIGANTFLPSYGNTSMTVNMNTPLTPSSYPQGWMRARFPANAAGTAPQAGAVSLIEFFAPVDADVNLVTLGPSVRISLDGSAGLLQTTTVGCANGAARCLALDAASTPIMNRTCSPIATGSVSGTTLTWGQCSIPTPAGTTGTPSGNQLTWTPSLSVAGTGDVGCISNMSVWGGVRCTSGGLTGCGPTDGLTLTPSNSVWDQELPNVTFSSATYATANVSVPEFIIPDTDTATYTGASFTGATVLAVECGTLAQLSCNEQ
jgi:hypothetical protein